MANNLFVSYRSDAAEPNLAPLISAMESLGACIQVQVGFWYINSEKDLLKAKEVIREAINPADTLMVIDASNNEFEANRTLREQVESRIRHVWD